MHLSAKRPRWLLLYALSGLLLAACGDDAEEAPAADTAAGADQAAPPDVDGPEATSDAEPADIAEPDALADNFGVVESKGHEDCEGLDPTHCALPMPSDYFLRDDGGQRRLMFGPTTLPRDRDDRPLDPSYWLDFDGWSAINPIVFGLPGATLDGTTGVFQPAASLEPGSRTILLNAETGERVAHWTEIDHFTLGDDAPDLFVMRPAARLDHDTRYIVAVRGLVDASGQPVAAPEGFRALRDREASKVKGIHARRERFEVEVFGVLEAAGIARSELQLAWDFTTATEDNATSDLLTMRDRLVEAMGDLGPTYTIDDVDEAPAHPDLATMVYGTMQVPSFLLPPEEDLRRLRRDAEGKPVAEGTEAVPFEVQIPHSAWTSDEPAAVLVYGHGLLGSKDEAHNGWLREMANRLNIIVVAVDMMGMTELDGATWAVHLSSDASVFPVFAEKPLQGMMNHVALARMMKARFAMDTDPRFTKDGAPLYDPTRIYYYGNSQGGTVGSMILTMGTDITRGVLGVPGCAYSLLLNRSSAFTVFASIIKILYSDPLEFAVLFNMIGSGWNRMEPLNYVSRMVHDPFPGTPPKDVMLHVARGDTQVHNQVSYILARTIGVDVMVPTPQEVWGLPEQSYPFTGSALVEYDFNKPPNPDPMLPPPEEHDTHGDLRKHPIAQDQLLHFLDTGEIITFCEGVCDPD